jgi:dTDP-4-amino-4,6-dideoxygalactose transaminase
VCGFNARLDSIQAAVLRAKLKRLDPWNTRRRELADSYRELLGKLDITLPAEPAYAESCYHLFVIQSARRDALRSALLAKKIECGIHYPVPLHLQPALKDYGYRHGDFPISEQLADRVLSLPMHPHLTNLELVRIAEVMEKGLETRQSLIAGEGYDFAACASSSRGA